MSVQYRDYYSDLGVARTATQAEIQRAYRKLARQHHPDVDKTAGATQRFQRITEAYEVLKDPETRTRYDTLGAAWKEGQDFSPPPGWQSRQGARGAEFSAEDLGSFSEFFESLFGARGGSPFERFEHGPGPGRGRGRPRGPRPGRDVEAELPIPLETAISGGTRAFELDTGSGSARKIEVRVPPGSSSGNVLRLRGQGAPSASGGASGDLLLRLVVAPPPGFVAVGDDLETTLRVSPPDAALGGRVRLRGPDGSDLVVTLAAGSSSGKTLRLRGLGMPRAGGGRGDLLAEVAIIVPAQLTAVERELYEKLRAERGDAPTGP